MRINKFFEKNHRHRREIRGVFSICGEFDGKQINGTGAGLPRMLRKRNGCGIFLSGKIGARRK